MVMMMMMMMMMMTCARMGPLRYPGPEANRWHGMSLSLTLMQTPTSTALQSLPELQPIMQQQPSQPNMPILRTLTFSYHFVIETSGAWNAQAIELTQ